MHCDLLLMLGTDYPFSEFLPQKGSVIQIDERAAVLGRRTPRQGIGAADREALAR
jgi:pyruvate dehydrogenase (quinone)